MSEILELTRKYLAAVEQCAVGPTLAAFYTEDVVQEEFPNQFTPLGARRELTQILEAAERGRALLKSQTFEVQNTIEQDNQIAIEILWTGILKTGAELKARFATILEFRDGRIARQRNYDCKL